MSAVMAYDECPRCSWTTLVWSRPPAGSSPRSAEESGGDRVELTDVPEGERAQERSQRKGGVGAGEEPAHPAVPQQGHVIDAVRAGGHARHQRGHFPAALTPLSVGTLIRWSTSSRSPALPASAISGTRPPADTRLGSSNVADTTGRA